jgi:hypothetical protein
MILGDYVEVLEKGHPLEGWRGIITGRGGASDTVAVNFGVAGSRYVREGALAFARIDPAWASFPLGAPST